MNTARKKANKKGLSPVIATVLLISLVLVLVMIIFMWARGFISEQLEKNGKPVDNVCKEVAFDAEYVLSPGSIDLQIVNRGNVPIYDFDIKYIGGDGNSDLRKFNLAVDVGSATDLATIPIDSDVDKVILYPMVLGSVVGKKINKAQTCLDNGKVIDV